jgi:peptidoglycan hydrolase-like protein with peptidoglycan-binding domain
VDGVFGARTVSVVLGFQRALGIIADGIVGPATWRALVSGMLSP